MIADLVERWAMERGDRLFVRVGDDCRTFGQMRPEVAAMSAALAARGVKAGDRVAITCPTSIKSITAFLAVATIGAIVAPLNIFLKGDSLEHQLRDCGCTAVVTDRDGLELLRPLVSRLPNLRFIVNVEAPDGASPDVADAIPVVPMTKAGPEHAEPLIRTGRSPLDPFAIIYTSGTTGLPKGCVISLAYAMLWADCTVDLCGIVESDVIFTAAPLFHISGVNPLLIALSRGIGIAFEPAFSASGYLARARATGGTVGIAVGWIPQTLLKQPPSPLDRDHSLRVMSTLQLSPDEQVELERRFGIVPCTQQFGQTECWPISYMPFERRTISTYAGEIAPHLIVEIHDDDGVPVADGESGEIVVRPRRPGVMFAQYWSDPARTLEVLQGLWYHTGDIGRVVDGQIQYLDRKKDSMRRRGENVSSFELEQTIGRYSAVKEVAVYGVKVPGEPDDAIKACLFVDNPATFPLADFVAFLGRELPYYAVPQLVEFVSALPRNASGRVMKDQLRKQPLDANTIEIAKLGIEISKQDRRSRT